MIINITVVVVTFVSLFLGNTVDDVTQELHLEDMSVVLPVYARSCPYARSNA